MFPVGVPLCFGAEAWLKAGGKREPDRLELSVVGGTAPVTILLVEDDEMLGAAIVEGLRPRYQTDWTRTIADSEAALSTGKYQLMLLDLNLPDGSGLNLLASLRRRGNPLPVLILSARDALTDRLAGLNGGADDYIVKPFDLDELSARCEAILRRMQGRSAPVIVHGNLAYEPATGRVSIDDKTITLSARELAIFDALMSNVGRVVGKSQLEERLYRWDETIESNTIEVHVSHLRRKIGRDRIQTIRGLGYVVPKVS